MRTSLLFFVLVLAAWSTAYADMINPLSVKFLDNDPCSFSICLFNRDAKPLQFLNSIGKEQSPKGIPAFTVLYILSEKGTGIFSCQKRPFD